MFLYRQVFLCCAMYVVVAILQFFCASQYACMVRERHIKEMLYREIDIPDGYRMMNVYQFIGCNR